MNIVFNQSMKKLSNKELFKAMLVVSPRLQVDDIDKFVEERLSGRHCNCPDGGRFILLPANDPAVKSGGKRYMQCMDCKGWSHL